MSRNQNSHRKICCFLCVSCIYVCLVCPPFCNFSCIHHRQRFLLDSFHYLLDCVHLYWLLSYCLLSVPFQGIQFHHYRQTHPNLPMNLTNFPDLLHHAQFRYELLNCLCTWIYNYTGYNDFVFKEFSFVILDKCLIFWWIPPFSKTCCTMLHFNMHY